MKGPLICSLLVFGCLRAAEGELDRRLNLGATEIPRDFVVLPNATNAVQFRLFTNAASEARHLFNTFEIEAHGEILIGSPGGEPLRRSLSQSLAGGELHNILVNGKGPELAHGNGLVVVEKASAPGWSYIGLDGSLAYRGLLKQFTRAILHVEPDLFIIRDHLVAGSPSSFQMRMHPPSATRVDAIWRDLRLELPRAGLRVHAPAIQKQPRHWERIDSLADRILEDTVTVQLGATNALGELNLLTVFATHRAGETRELAFRLLEGNNAIGARIHREGLPTLIAFRTGPADQTASLTGFEFGGPVGVSVFTPKKRPSAK